MLNAFKEHLKSLSADPKDRFASHIRRLGGGQEAPRRCVALRRLVLATPAMAGRIRGWTDDASMPRNLLRAQKFALAYLYSPVDFLPDHEYGLFGYVDDAFIVGAVYESTLRELEAHGVTPDEAGGPSLPDVAAGLQAAREVLPREASRMTKLLSEVEHGTPHGKALAAAAEAGARRERP